MFYPCEVRTSCKFGDSVEVEKISPLIGAKISGLDLRGKLSEHKVKALRKIWLENQLLVIRNQELENSELYEISKLFGVPDTYPFLNGIDGFPEITPILKKETETMNFGGVWHSDTTYQPCPPMATMLYALELPPVGGDTLFANQVQAYESLSDGLKETLSTLKIVCRSDKTAVMATRADRIAEEGRDDSKDNLVGIHPVIRTHPETGKKALYVNKAHSCYFQGWSVAESDGLLNFLFAHQIREEFQCRHVWQQGDLAIWDNRCTLHYPVNDYHGHRRLLHRITLKGDKPV